MDTQRTGMSRRSAVIYCRTATTGQRERDPLMEQEARCRQLATDCDYAVADGGVYREVASGMEYRDWAQLSAMRNAIRRGGVDAVIVCSLDRLGRDLYKSVCLVEEFSASGVAFLTVEGDDMLPFFKMIREFHTLLEGVS